MDIKVAIRDKDRNIGAMVKALAFEIDGSSSVKGSTKEVLETQDHYTFHLSNDEKANKFIVSLGSYLPSDLAKVQH